MRPKKRRSLTWALHHDNTPAHKAHSVVLSLADLGIPVVQQTSYSPYIAPCDFWLFPKLKMALKGKRFDDIDTIKENTSTMKLLSSILKVAFEKVFNNGRTAGISA
jgi:hypothetical protein